MKSLGKDGVTGNLDMVIFMRKGHFDMRLTASQPALEIDSQPEGTYSTSAIFHITITSTNDSSRLTTQENSQGDAVVVTQPLNTVDI